MTAPSERSFAQELATWAQIFGIVIASAWGVYTFLYKEIYLPRAAPVNVSVDLQLKKIERPNLRLLAGENNKGLIAVEMTVSATNPSPREVTLFPSAWIALGYNVRALSQNPSFFKEANSSLKWQYVFQAEKHATVYMSSPDPVAIGRVFQDTSLKPNERITRKIVFHIPPGQYDLIDVQVLVPTMAKKEGATLEWKYDDKNKVLEPTIYRVAKNGQRKEMEKEKDGGYASTDLELQSVGSISTLSLWQ